MKPTKLESAVVLILELPSLKKGQKIKIKMEKESYLNQLSELPCGELSGRLNFYEEKRSLTLVR